MAGRPVTAHGSQTMLYWVIVFAILMAASLGLFIFQLTNNKAAQNRAELAERRASLYGEPPRYYSEEARNRGNKVFTVLNDDRKDLAFLVTGVKEDVGPTVLAKAQRVLKQVTADNSGAINETDTLLTALERLNKLHNDERQRADETTAALDEAVQDKDSLTTQLNTARQTFEEQVASLQAQLEQNRADQLTALGQKDEQLRELQGLLDAREQQLQQLKREGNIVVREKDVDIHRLENQVAMLQKQIQALKPSTFDPNAILTKADGRVLRAVPGSDVVYVNLGTADKIKPGMGFEIYSQTREARTSLRGKASVEVVTTMEDTSECRITRRLSGQPIIEGDINVNIAYERQRQPKFVIRGQFDLDYDGQPDFDGARQIANMIRQWGGIPVDELDETVDFVVIGQSPSGPYFDDDTIISDIVRDQAQRQQLAGLDFFQLLDRAASMYIPVITQNQFLFLTGNVGDQLR